MKKLKLILFCFLLFSLSFYSCEKELTSEISLTSENTKDTENISVPVVNLENGILTFQSYKDYSETVDYLQTMHPQDVNAWFADNGFTTLEAIYNNLFKEISKLNDENEIRGYIRNNRKYLTLQVDVTGEEEVVRKTDLFHNYFANENFVFKIGDNIINLIEDFSSNGNGFRSCGNPNTEIYTKSSGCWKGRRAKMIARSAVGNLGPPTYQIVHENSMRLRGQRKWGCVWINYDTALDFDTNPFPSLESEYNNTTFSGTLQGVTGHSAAYSLLLVADQNSSGSGLPDVKSAYAKGTTRGIGNAWVELDCND